MKKLIPISLCIGLIVVILTACGLINQGDPSLDATRVAIAVQQTGLAQGQNPQVEQLQPQVDVPVQPTYTLYPTYTQEAPPQDEPPQEVPPTETVTLTPTVTMTATQEVLFQSVTKDRIEFACHLMGYPTTLTITVEMSDVNRGAALFWRLHEKATDYKMDWTLEDMVRAGGNKRTYTFDADIPGGTANFGYPAIGESWFEFQIISNDGVDRTEVFADVTFFPCP
ncbi:MAG: hypothetical protein U9R53_10495 [Chloroflexota bacterium]|nr:hypothetical protein [Chloroflexota bacterium]